TPQRLAELAALEAGDPLARRAALLAVSPLGVDLPGFERAEGQALPPPAPEEGLVSDGWALGSAHLEAARERVLASLAAFHLHQPDELGPDAARLRRLTLPRLTDAAWRALLAALVAQGAVSLSGAWVHLPEHGERLGETDRRIAASLAPPLAAAGYDGAWVRDLARDGGIGEPLLRVTLARMARRGELHQVVRDLYYPRATMEALGALCRRLATEDDGADAADGGRVGITAARFRDATGLGRKRAIQILEYFDRIGLLRRVGDLHRLRSDSRLFEGANQDVDQDMDLTADKGVGGGMDADAVDGASRGADEGASKHG
ncbi:MAG: SelB C-terminal domain-containing protein, partial [Burkholderiaceae bacterium]